MAGLSLGNQNQPRRSDGMAGLWWVALVLIVLSIALMTLYVRADGGSGFAAVRSAVQSVTKPVEKACSALSAPLEALQGIGTDDELEALQTENEQLRTLVAELEEYRQQAVRLSSLVELFDTYGLESISAEVTSMTTGWDRTATINKGADDGIAVGQGVVSSCGLYGQVESVTDTTAVVRLINDASSSTSAMIQSTHTRGIVQGAYDGTLTMEYVSIDSTVGEGDIIISSGLGGAYPRGLIIGTVSAIETDSSRLYYSLSIQPIYNIDDCEEVLVLTGDESSTQNLLDEELIEQITSGTVSTDDTSSSEDDSSSTAASDGTESSDDNDGLTEEEQAAAEASSSEEESAADDEAVASSE